MKLIDKDALIAEIERRKRKLLDQMICESDKERVVRTAHQLNRIILFLDDLEVKEVDLEKEIKEHIDDEWSDEWSGDVGNWIRWRRGTSSMIVEDVKDIAKHFFELGMAVDNKAQKGE